MDDSRFSLISFVLILYLGFKILKRGSLALFGVSFSWFFLWLLHMICLLMVCSCSYVESARVWFSGSTFSFEFGTYVDALAGLLLLLVLFPIW